MTIDERDLGNRPAVDALLPLMDKRDTERARLRAELETVIAMAEHAVQAGNLAAAAILFDELSDRFRVACFIGEADAWHRRAADAHTVERLKKRNAKKGRAHR